MEHNFARVGEARLRRWLTEELAPRTVFGRARATSAHAPGDEAAAAGDAARVLRDHAALARADAFAAAEEVLGQCEDAGDALARLRDLRADATDLFRLANFAAAARLLARIAPPELAPFDAAARAGLAAVSDLLEPHRTPHGFRVARSSDPAIARALAAYETTDARYRERLAARHDVLRAAGLSVSGDDRHVLLRAQAQALDLPEIRELVRVVEETPVFLLWEARRTGELAAADDERGAALTAYDAAHDAALARCNRRLARHAEVFANLAAAIGDFDLRVTRAAFVERHGAPFCVPEIGAAADARFEGARHLMLERARGEAYVPVDLVVRGPVVVTGAHMGGKTSALYAVATAAALFAVGMPVPARAARLRVWSAVLFLPPPEDAYPELSSFAGEMRGAREACAAASAGTRLVVCDEFARSTNAAEGRALTVAFLRYLAARGDDVIAVTHLDGVAEAVPAERYQADGDFSDTEKTMAYRLRRVDPRAPVGSRALRVAEEAGLPREIVAEAARLLGSDARA